ncbi:hypothetical protein HWV62_33315 [Athelia sp. TMB]|nr:hypothetical protein HWV62_33315 [Athelia sp. TMB]
METTDPESLGSGPPLLAGYETPLLNHSTDLTDGTPYDLDGPAKAMFLAYVHQDKYVQWSPAGDHSAASPVRPEELLPVQSTSSASAGGKPSLPRARTSLGEAQARRNIPAGNDLEFNPANMVEPLPIREVSPAFNHRNPL